MAAKQVTTVGETAGLFELLADQMHAAPWIHNSYCQVLDKSFNLLIMHFVVLGDP